MNRQHSWPGHGFVTTFFPKLVIYIGRSALGKRNAKGLHSPMEPADAHYQSFLIRIWREDQTQRMRKTEVPVVVDDGAGEGWLRKTASAVVADNAAGEGWLFQLEDIASGDTCYFHSIGALTGYMDAKFRTGADQSYPDGD